MDFTLREPLTYIGKNQFSIFKTAPKVPCFLGNALTNSVYLRFVFSLKELRFPVDFDTEKQK